MGAEAAFFLALLAGIGAFVCIGAPLISAAVFGLFGLVGGLSTARALRSALPEAQHSASRGIAARWAVGFSIGGVMAGVLLLFALAYPDRGVSALLAMIGLGLVGALGGGMGSRALLRRLAPADDSVAVGQAEPELLHPTPARAMRYVRLLFALQALAAAVGLCWAAARPFSRVSGVATGQPALLSGHRDGINAVVFSPDAAFAASASDDDSARVWDLASGAESHVLRHDGDVVQIVFAPDGAQLATASSDDTVRMWDVQSGALLHSHDTGVGMYDVAYSPDGALLAGVGGATAAGGTARVWDAGGGQQLHVLAGQEGAIEQAAFSPDGRLLITVGKFADVFVWDAASGEMQRLLDTEGGLQFASFSPDGSLLVGASKHYSDDVVVWRMRSGELLHRLAHATRPREAVFLDNGRRLATWSEDETVSVWDLSTGERLSSFQVAPGVKWRQHSSAAIFSADGNTVARLPGDPRKLQALAGPIRMWNVQTGAELPAIDNIRYPPAGAEFTPDGQQLLVWYGKGGDYALQLWDVPGS